jgi:hypothetical protein
MKVYLFQADCSGESSSRLRPVRRNLLDRQWNRADLSAKLELEAIRSQDELLN